MNTDSWPDVCLKNAVVLLKACEAMEIDPQVVYQALPSDVEHTRVALKKAWVTLAEFNRCVDAIVNALGHPAHLITVGRFASQVAFGSQHIERLLLNGILRFVTNPAIGIREIPSAARGFNVNKTWYSLTQGGNRNREIFKIVYNDGPEDTAPRDPLEDILSLLYFVRGVLEAVAPMWWRQGRIGYVRYRLVQIPILDAVHRLCPNANAVLKNNQLLIDGTPHGEVVYLCRDTELGGEFIGDHSPISPHARLESGRPVAVHLTNHITSVCRRTGRLIPLMVKGEMFAHPDYPLTSTIIEMQWRSSWLGRILEHFFRRTARQFTTGVGVDAERSDEQHRVATVEQRLRIADDYLARGFPKPHIAKAAIDGTYCPQKLMTCVVLIDIVDFTVKSWQMQTSEVAQKIKRFTTRMIDICKEHGGWFYKFRGDGGTFIFTNGFDDPPVTTMPAMTRKAISCAREMQRIAREIFDWELRIGIHVDEVSWYVLEDGFTFEGTGIGIDMAARLEAVAGNGNIMVSEAVIQMVGFTEEFHPPSEVRIKHEGTVKAYILRQPGETFESLDTAAVLPVVAAVTEPSRGNIAAALNLNPQLRVICSGSSGLLDEEEGE